jgi:menaquinone-dependent protoporphyrinogen IX oxidase
MLVGAHKLERIVSAFTFLERYHKDVDEFLNQIVRVISDETWALFVNAETKEQPKQCMHTHAPDKPESLNKRCLSESWWHLFSGAGKEC